MDWQFTPYALPALIAAALCAMVAVFVWRHQRFATGAALLTLLMLAISEWSLTNGLELLAVGAEAKFFWVKAQMLGGTLAPLVAVLFAAVFSGQLQWSSRRAIVALGLFPALTLLLVLTNDSHHWIWRFAPEVTGGVNVLRLQPGLWLQAYIVYAYALAGLIFLLIFSASRRAARIYRQQSLALLVSVIAPVTGTLLERFGLSPIPNFRLVPLGFALGGLALLVGLFRFRLMEFTPIARHTIIENMREAMLVLDARGWVVDVNPAALAALNLSIEQTIGVPVAEALAAHPTLSALAQAAPPAEAEVALDMRCYAAHLASLAAHPGRRAGAVLTLHDITDHRRAEMELIQKEAAEREHSRYLQVLNTLARATLETRDLPTLMQTAADQMRALFTADHCFITLWDNIHHRPIPTAAAGKFRDSYPGYQPKPDEVTLTESVLRAGRALVVDDGRNAPEKISRSIAARFDSHAILGLPLIAGEKKLGAIFICFQQAHAFCPTDIERGEQAAQQVALTIAQAHLVRDILEEHTRLQAIIETSRDGILLISADRRVLTVNPPALASLQLPGLPEEWVGRPIRAALQHMRPYAPEVVRVLLNEMRRIRQGDEPLKEGEIQIPPRTLHWFNLPVHAEGSQPGRLLVLHDVTQERQLATLRDELTHMMVHDLRSPLGTISTALEFLSAETEDALSAEAAQTLDIARESTLMTLDLVGAILDVSRLESGQLALDRAPVSLAELCAEVLRLHAPAIHAQGLSLHNAISDYLPLAHIDRNLIGRVLQNLLNNAIKFTPPGGAIQLSALVEAREPPQLVVVVSDSGPGIEPMVQGRLFQKFVTGRPPAQGRRGSGLGLAFCKLVIEAHGGHIWAESLAGHGATFLFTLPITPDEPAFLENDARALAYN